MRFIFCPAAVKSVTIPNSVTSIGERAFFECVNLTSITIPDSVTSIRYRAFFECVNLKSITLPDSITRIEEWAFMGCKSLKSITVPKSVTVLGPESIGYGLLDEEMWDGPYILPGFTIKCKAGSAAEKYAKENEIDYELI